MANGSTTWLKSVWPALLGVLVGAAIVWFFCRQNTAVAPASSRPQTVRIIKVPDECIVVPPAAIVARGGDVTFTTVKTGARITFTDIPSLKPIELKEGESKTVSLRGIEPGAYRYDVVGDDGSHCRGFSGPIIIIE